MSDEPLGIMSLRVSDDDVARLEKLCGLFPLLGKTTIAREAMRRGMADMEAIAAATSDVLARVAALGVKPAQKARSRSARK